MGGGGSRTHLSSGLQTNYYNKGCVHAAAYWSSPAPFVQALFLNLIIAHGIFYKRQTQANITTSFNEMGLKQRTKNHIETEKKFTKG